MVRLASEQGLRTRRAVVPGSYRNITKAGMSGLRRVWGGKRLHPCRGLLAQRGMLDARGGVLPERAWLRS